MWLKFIIVRLDNGYYRQLTSVMADIRLILDACDRWTPLPSPSIHPLAGSHPRFNLEGAQITTNASLLVGRLHAELAMLFPKDAPAYFSLHQPPPTEDTLAPE